MSPDVSHKMTDHHKENHPEPGDKSHETTNQSHPMSLDNGQQRTAAVTTPHDSGDKLLSHVTQQARARKGRVTFWSLPREVRNMIWNQVLGSEDDIFQANLKSWAYRRGVSTNPHPVGQEEGRRLRSKDVQPRWRIYVDQSRLLISSRPPLPLAHLCQESRAFALQKYDCAYAKARRPGLNQERGPRFRWLSRSATRVLDVRIPSLDYDEPHYHPTPPTKLPFEEPLGENKSVVFRCSATPIRYKSLPPGKLETDMHPAKLDGLLEVLKSARDYQIMLAVDEWVRRPFYIDQNQARNWGIFDARTTGLDFAEDRGDPGHGNVFVPVQDTSAMVQLLRNLNRRGRMLDIKALGLSRHVRRGKRTHMVSRMHVLEPLLERPGAYFTEEDGEDGKFRRLEEGEMFPVGNWWKNPKDRQREPELLRLYLEPLERFWADNFAKHELASKSRYGRMPKIGFVYQVNINSRWGIKERWTRNYS